MKKTKMFLAITITVLLMICLAGCAKKGICEGCGKKAVLYRFTTTSSLLGLSESNTSKLCSNCLDEAIKAADEDGMGITTYTYEEIK